MRSWRVRDAKALRNKDGKHFARVAFVLDFAFRAPARDAVRGFCATFATKSGIKDSATRSRPKADLDTA